MRKYILVLFVTALFLRGIVTAATIMPDPPRLPMELSGTVTIGGVAAPVGTVIQANGSGVGTGIPGNPLTLDRLGVFGGGTWDPKLIVQGTPVAVGQTAVADGTQLSFTVNGEPAQVRYSGRTLWTTTIEFFSGSAERVDINLEIVAPVPPVREDVIAPEPEPEPTPDPIPDPVIVVPTPTPEPTPAPTPAPISAPGLPVVPEIEWGPNMEILSIRFWDYPNNQWVTITMSDYR